jgi:hypothetical protein
MTDTIITVNRIQLAKAVTRAREVERCANNQGITLRWRGCLEIISENHAITLTETFLKNAQTRGDAFVFSYPAKPLADCLKTSRGKTVEIVIDEKGVLRIMDGAMAICPIERKPYESLDSSGQCQLGPLVRKRGLDFGLAVEKVEYSVGWSTVFQLDRIRLFGENGKLFIGSTDNQTLNVARLACDIPAGLFPEGDGVNISPSALRIIMGFCFQYHASELHIGMMSKDILFVNVTDSSQAIVAAIRTDDGNYPSLLKLANEIVCDKLAQFKREPLIGALKRALAVTGHKKGKHGAQGMATLDFGDPTEAEIMAKSKDGGESYVERLAVEYTGEPIKVGFHPRKLLDPLNRMHTDWASLGFSLPKKPMKLEGDPGYVCLVTTF